MDLVKHAQGYPKSWQLISQKYRKNELKHEVDFLYVARYNEQEILAMFKVHSW